MTNGLPYRGRAIEVAFRRLGSHVVCEARLLGRVTRLAAHERLAAQQFAAGLSHKEVARRLGISPHTVRAQLAQVYRKLQVSDKVALARCLRDEDE